MLLYDVDVRGNYLVPWLDWTHADFVGALYANRFMMPYLLNVLRQYTN
jgi:hypothetical protein